MRRRKRKGRKEDEDEEDNVEKETKLGRRRKKKSNRINKLVTLSLISPKSKGYGIPHTKEAKPKFPTCPGVR